MSDIITHYLTRDEALKFIKRHRRGKRCFVRLDIFGYSQLPDETGTARGWEVGGLLPVSYHQAAYALRNISSVFADKGVKVKIGYADNCLFIG